MRRSSRGVLARLSCSPLLVFAVATVVVTWPWAVATGTAVSEHADYFVNIWNFWWVGEALFERGVSPYGTDALFHPDGVSLARHTLSLGNAVFGALGGRSLGYHDAYRGLLLVHFWLSGWAFYWMAREFTRSRRGAVLAGMVWTFSPFHLYYLSQLNLATMELLPLAGLCMARIYRRGGAGPVIGLAACVALLGLTAEYYLVYAALVGALLLLGGPSWAPSTAWSDGARRLAIASVPSGVAAVIVGWPLLSAAFGETATPSTQAAATTASLANQALVRSNALTGFLWIAPPERTWVSWPTFFGYVPLLLLAVGWRGLLRRPFWIGFGLVTFVLGLGPRLWVDGAPTDFALPYAFLSDLPVLDMLRKPDRFALLTTGAVAVLCALAWQRVERRLTAAATRRVAFVVCAALVLIERAGPSLETFEPAVSPHLAQLEADDESLAVLELPAYPGRAFDARANAHQTVHGRNLTHGYVTDLALGPAQRASVESWRAATRALRDGDPTGLLARLRETNADVVLLNKVVPKTRKAGRLHEETVWAPFFLARRDLVGVRQRGLVEFRRDERNVARYRAAVEDVMGPADYEDDRVAVYRRRSAR